MVGLTSHYLSSGEATAKNNKGELLWNVRSRKEKCVFSSDWQSAGPPPKQWLDFKLQSHAFHFEGMKLYSTIRRLTSIQQNLLLPVPAQKQAIFRKLIRALIDNFCPWKPNKKKVTGWFSNEEQN